MSESVYGVEKARPVPVEPNPNVYGIRGGPAPSAGGGILDAITSVFRKKSP